MLELLRKENLVEYGCRACCDGYACLKFENLNSANQVIYVSLPADYEAAKQRVLLWNK
jgi:excinuclease UvrABC helicase subunit UvrB